MSHTSEFILRVVFIGAGATIAMDLWALLLKQLGIPSPNFAFLGRWIGHLPHGQWTHESIAKAAPIIGELWIGWFADYSIGVAFAVLLLAVYGLEWARKPTLLPALIIGIVTVVAPLFILQPALGAGIASSKTPKPLLNCIVGDSYLAHLLLRVRCGSLHSMAASNKSAVLIRSCSPHSGNARQPQNAGLVGPVLGPKMSP